MRHLLIAMGLLVCGCYGQPGKTELVGTYVWNDPKPPHKLELKPDGSYRHSWSENGRSVMQDGAWTLAAGGNGCSNVQLNDYAEPADKVLETERFEGTMTFCGLRDIEGPFLIINDDLSWIYRKQ